MNSSVENDVRKLHVVGTAGVAARLRGRGEPARLVLAAPRTYRIRGELVSLPRVVGVARRPFRIAGAVREQARPAA